MWMCFKDGFLSIVAKDCAPDELLVRARRADHIKATFPDAEIVERVDGCTDYQFRAVIKRDVIKEKMAAMIDNYSADNFKNSVKDHDLHSAYNQVWHVMSRLQPVAPYSHRRGRRRPLDKFSDMDA